MFCYNCGNEVSLSWNFCPHCRANLSDSSMEKKKEEGSIYKYVPTKYNIDSKFVVSVVRKSNLDSKFQIMIPKCLVYSPISEYLESHLYTEFNIGLKDMDEEMKKDCKYVGLGDIEKYSNCPAYLRNIRDFVLTDNGIYYIQSGKLYYLKNTGGRVLLLDNLQDCISMSYITYRDNRRELCLTLYTGAYKEGSNMDYYLYQIETKTKVLPVIE